MSFVSCQPASEEMSCKMKGGEEEGEKEGVGIMLSCEWEASEGGGERCFKWKEFNSVAGREKMKAKGKVGSRPKPAEIQIGRHALITNMQLRIVCTDGKYFHQHLSVLTIGGGPLYLLGVQIARILHRKSFNLHHFMTKKHLELCRANQDQIRFRIPDGLCFVDDALYRFLRFPNED